MVLHLHDSANYNHITVHLQITGGYIVNIVIGQLENRSKITCRPT